MHPVACGQIQARSPGPRPWSISPLGAPSGLSPLKVSPWAPADALCPRPPPRPRPSPGVSHPHFGGVGWAISCPVCRTGPPSLVQGRHTGTDTDTPLDARRRQAAAVSPRRRSPHRRVSRVSPRALAGGVQHAPARSQEQERRQGRAGRKTAPQTGTRGGAGGGTVRLCRAQSTLRPGSRGPARGPGHLRDVAPAGGGQAQAASRPSAQGWPVRLCSTWRERGVFGWPRACLSLRMGSADHPEPSIPHRGGAAGLRWTSGGWPTS